MATRCLGLARAQAHIHSALRGTADKRRRVGNAQLSPESRAALREINLHFHDLRREAGSRWLDGGVPLQVIRDRLGHTNISETSTYLESTSAGQHDAMRGKKTGLQQIATRSEKAIPTCH